MPKFEIFSSSAKELKKTRTIAITALLIAINVTLDILNIRIQLTPDVRIAFGFLCNAMIGMLFGPVVAMMSGVGTDVLGYLVNSGGGAYFPGYSLTAIVAGLIWGAWLYKKPVKIWNVIGAKVSINLLCNIGLNTIWTSILFGKAINVILPARIIKNIIMLPIEVILLYSFAKIVYSINKRSNKIDV